MHRSASAEVISIRAERAGEGAVAAVQPRLRLTRRGRLVFSTLAAILLTAVLALGAFVFAPGAQASAEAGGQQFGYVMVEPGETLWSVATALDEQRDPRDLVAEIVQLNQLPGSGVQAGQALAVPLEYAEAPGVLSASELGLD